MINILRMITDVSKRTGSDNREAIFKALVEEVGELATEISIDNGTKKRTPSPDGVGGEGIDVLIVIVDFLHDHFGEEIHSQEFANRVQSKLNKWESKCK